ncbi:MAG: hypothetical protein IPK22_28705 [Verrucomicrobiaceae bacterium]|nr:hypothetical protein [Verrucomicrobiaceae bacterium]
MPAHTQGKIDLNTSRISDLNALKDQGVKLDIISRLKQFREAGAFFRHNKDLLLIGLSNVDVSTLLKVAKIVPLPAATGQVRIKTKELKCEPAKRSGFQLVFTALNQDTGEVVQEGFGLVEHDGSCVLRYSEAATGGTFLLSAKGPDGAIVEIERATEKGHKLKVPEAKLAEHVLKLPALLTPLAGPGITPPPVAPPAPPFRIRGRVVCSDPLRKTTNLPIVILAATKASPAAEDFFPICNAETEDRGYFTTGVPIFGPGDYEKLTAALALVANQRLPIRLDNDAAGKLRLPARVILVLAAQADAAKDNGQHDCGCSELNFLEKKVLDEFNYYTVVRTTEPQIKALSLTEPPEVELAELLPPDDPNRGMISKLKLPPASLSAFLDRNPVLDKLAVTKLADLARSHAITKLTTRPVKFPTGRIALENGGGIDWDEEPTIYQATTVAHGHLLQFKQEWISGGYSIGDLIYSLPLAPGQKKQIVVFDWDRKDSAANTQQLDYQESLYNSLSRDRDVNEVARAALHEEMEGESHSSSWGVGGGLGGAGIAGPVALAGGFAAGGGGADANARQESARTTSASSQQNINDRTVQAGNAVRSQRSTVVQTVSQGERFQTSAEVVANYNHCHAITIQYFEVLRHFEIRTRLASAQECLFVPLLMNVFTRKKALRWRSLLARCLKDRRLAGGFDALERIDEEKESAATNYYDKIGMPKLQYAEEEVEYLEGEIRLSFHFTRPADDKDGAQIPAEWTHLVWLLGADFFAEYLKTSEEKDEAFARHAGPRLAQEIISRLKFQAVAGGGSAQDLPLEATLMSEFKEGNKLLVSLRMNGGMSSLRREQIEFIEITTEAESQSSKINKILENNVRMVVHSGSMRYRTKHLHEHLFQSQRISNDLTPFDPVRIFTPLSRQAMRNPRQEDAELHNSLLRHLNENLEYYHQCIWYRMDPQRRFLLLDGIKLPGRAGGRSAASVVENRLIGIVGNCLVLPVASGNRLDPNLADDLDLYTHYYSEPADPVQFALPTKGVYAEAVMGKCNSCERKEEDRFWRWEESPIPDSPTTINPVTPPTPTVNQPDLQPQQFTAPIINLQNAPAAPDPQGFGKLMDLLGKSDAFRDMAGLSETQKNSLAAMQRAMQSAEFFGGKAADLVPLAASLTPAGQKLEQIRQARAHNLLSEEDARLKAKGALEQDNTLLSQARQVSDLVKEGGVDPEIGRQVIEQIVKKVGASGRTGSEIISDIAKNNPTGSISFTEPSDNGIKLASWAGSGNASQAKPLAPQRSTVLVVFQENSGKLGTTVFGNLLNGMSQPDRDKIEGAVDFWVEEFEKLFNGFEFTKGKQYDDVLVLEDQRAIPEEFSRVARDLAAKGYVMDIITIGHGSVKSLNGFGGKSITDQTLIDLKSAHGSNLPIRMVYMMNCRGGTLSQTWVDIGAQVAGGHINDNYIPEPMLRTFWNDWLDGKAFSKALSNAYESTKGFWMFLYDGLKLAPSGLDPKKIIEGSKPDFKGEGLTSIGDKMRDDSFDPFSNSSGGFRL